MNHLVQLLSDADFIKAVPFEKITFPANSIMLEVDEDGQDLFVVASGEAEIVSGLLKDSQGQPLKIHRLGVNDVFGELSMFDKGPRSARVNAITDCQVYKINGPDLIAFLDVCPDKGYFVLRDLLVHTITHIRQNNLRTQMVMEMYLHEHDED